MPDADQLRLQTLKTDLDTYMNETVTKLAIGDYKIADIDTYMHKIKSLRLEEVLSIYQKAHNTFVGK